MQLTLAPFGPPLWYLVVPNIKISLTIVSPGPVEVDFLSLPLDQKRYIYASILDGQLESSIPLELLYPEVYPPVEEPPVSPEEIVLEAELPPPETTQVPVVVLDEPTPTQPIIAQPISLEDKLSHIQETAQKKRDKVLERGRYLLTQNSNLIQATLKHEEDVSLLREMIAFELEGKKRKNILAFLRKRIGILQKQKVKEIEKSLYQNSYKRSKKEPIMEVEESNKKIILVGVHE